MDIVVNLVAALAIWLLVRRELRATAPDSHYEALAVQFRAHHAHLLGMVEDIFTQLNSESNSVRDTINRLNTDERISAELLQEGVRSDRIKMEMIREQLRHITREVHRLTTKMDESLKSGDRVEQDLADAHKRADEVIDGEHGAAADAALQTKE